METIKVTVELPVEMVKDFMDLISTLKAYSKTKAMATAKAIDLEEKDNNSIGETASLPTGNLEGLASLPTSSLTGEPTGSLTGLPTGSLTGEPKSDLTGKPKSIEEVRRYIVDNDLNVNVDKFYRYYSDRNWKDGKGEDIQNWKAVAENWSKREYKNSKQDVQLRKRNNQVMRHEPEKENKTDDMQRMIERYERTGSYF